MNDEQLSPQTLGRRADVEPAFLRRALASGAMGDRQRTTFTAVDATRLRFLAAWHAAGLPVETVGELVDKGEIAFSFLDVGGLAPSPRLPVTYRELAAETGLPVAVLQRVHQSLGFAAPAASELIREDDRVVTEWLEALAATGLSEDAALRLLRVYSSSLRRIAQATTETYESEIEARLRARGATEQQLMEGSGQAGRRLAALLEETILSIYRRHRQHVWLDHSITHVEIILESEGLYERMDRPPCVCFVDLTGYTRITEERGDDVAADLAGRLASLVEGIAQRHDGRPIKWLGDGGMFVFREPGPSVEAAVEIVTRAPASGLPPTHIGIHCGPVVFQDGDIFGRTVNTAARLASAAGAGEVLVSEQIAQRLRPDVLLQDVGALQLKGLAEPFPAHRVLLPEVA